MSQQLQTFLNDNPNALLGVARAELRLGKRNAAKRTLRQFVRMGQSADLTAVSPDFSGLVKDATFGSVRAGMRANTTPIALGSAVFTLHDASILAEDVDYDSHGKRFYLTSVREGKIESIDAAGRARTFAKAPDGWPMLAIKVDAARGMLWATEVATQGLRFAPKSDWGRSVVLCYRLKDGTLLRRIDGPRPSALGDMLLTPHGEVIVSDGDGAGIYRVPARGAALERIDRGDFVSPQTPAMDPDGRHLFVPDYVRGIGVLDRMTRRVRWLSANGRFALEGIDGMYFDRGRLIAVQNGTSPERVVAFTLDPTRTTIQSETIIERSTRTLGDPTHGVVIGGFFYYIANSGWDSIDARGDVRPGATVSPPRIMRVRMLP